MTAADPKVPGGSDEQFQRDPQASAPPVLEARDMIVERGGRQVLALDRFGVGAGETVAVVGPNGAGKSTLLLTLAMLIPPTRGTLLLHGRTMNAHTALTLRRSIGLVLPDPLLLDVCVRKNVATGLAFRGLRGADADRRVDEWLDRFGILGLRDRHARELSSGEAQRVSLARAFVLEPELLLLDEPFASVDPVARERLAEDTARVLRESARGCVVVTHDLDEASRLGTRMAVILDGRLRQDATPDEVFHAPVDMDVAQFVGLRSRIPGRIVAVEDGKAVVDTGAFELRAASGLAVGTEVWCCLRPSDLTLWTAQDAAPVGAANRLVGQVTDLSPGTTSIRVTVDAGHPVVAEVSRRAAEAIGLGFGMRVAVEFAARSVHLVAVTRPQPSDYRSAQE